MGRFLVHWLTTGLALWVSAFIVPGVSIETPAALLVAAFVLGFINAILKPILVILTLPITILTLGLFYFVVNGAAYALTAYLVPGFKVESVGAAILGALVVSLVSWFIGAFTGRPQRRDFER